MQLAIRLLQTALSSTLARMMMGRLVNLGVIGLLAAIAVGCTINARATVPEPNMLGTAKATGKYQIDVSSVPEEMICSQQGGLKDFCVQGFRTAIDGGVDKVLARYIDQSKPGPQHRAVFRLVKFSHSVTSGGGETAGPSVKLTMRWQFEVLDDGGAPLLQLAETTDGPEQISNVSAADSAVGALLEAVMDKIVVSIKDSWPSKPADQTPATSPAGAAANETPPATPAAAPTPAAASASANQPAGTVPPAGAAAP